MANGVLLLGLAVFVLYEAWRRLSEPAEVAAGPMLAFATIGLVVNGLSLLILRDAQADSLNVRGAYLEILGDLAGSVAVIVAAVVIALTGWVWADVVASFAIGVQSCRARSPCCATRPRSSWNRRRAASTWSTSGNTSSRHPAWSAATTSMRGRSPRA